jgi:hypothetical protein
MTDKQVNLYTVVFADGSSSLMTATREGLREQGLKFLDKLTKRHEFEVAYMIPLGPYKGGGE